ncbi:MAG TPA: hypothetical protein PLS22_14705 [Aquabacterium sp.]|jgi:hypothetical protein|nr:hypothetical protein [Aquabacterium sp.]
MPTNIRQQVFESVARSQPKLREILSSDLEQTITVLVKMNDVEQLRRAQGRAQYLQNLIAELDGATGSPNRKVGTST